MKSTLNRQAGFAHMVILVVVVVVAVIAGSGYAVYHAHRKTKAENDNTQTTSTGKQNKKTTPSKADSTTPPATAYFMIKEWGVQAPYSGSDLTYSPVSGYSNEMWLTSKAINATLPASDTACMTGNAGYIGRYLPTDTLPGPAQQTAQDYFSQDFAADAKPDYAKVGSYYYLYVAPVGDCGAEAPTLENQAVSSARSIVDSLQAVPN